MVYKHYPRIPPGATGNTLASAPAQAVGKARPRSNTTKRLPPGAPETKRLLEHFGDALLCVPYRTEPESGYRLTTVELIIDERDGPPAREVWVRVGFGETELRHRIKEAGGTWDGSRKLWRLSGAAAKALGLQKRIVKNIQ